MPLGSALPRSAAHRQLVRAAGRLLWDARRACEREGVEATPAELCARIGARIGLPGAEVAHCLGLSCEAQPAVVVAAAGPPGEILRLEHTGLRGRIEALCGEILGERERAVFLARCLSAGDRGSAADRLAAELGVTCERVHQLEVSARRKIAAALAHDGPPDAAAMPKEGSKLRLAYGASLRTTSVSA